MFAHEGSVRAGTGELHLAGTGKQTAWTAGDFLEDAFVEAPLEEVEETGNSVGAAFLKLLPAGCGESGNDDLDFVERAAHDQGGDLTVGDLEVDDGTIACIGAATGQAVGIVAVGPEVGAPLQAPERGRDLPAGDADRRQHPSGFGHLLCLRLRLAAAFGDGHVGSKAGIAVSSGHASSLAVASGMSRRMCP